MSKMVEKEYLAMLGARLKQHRINLGLSQKDLEEKAGVSLRSISRFEQGASIQLDNFIKLLTALNLDDRLKLLADDQSKRPSNYLENNYKVNQRVHKKEKEKRNFVWGEDK